MLVATHDQKKIKARFKDLNKVIKTIPKNYSKELRRIKFYHKNLKYYNKKINQLKGRYTNKELIRVGLDMLSIYKIYDDALDAEGELPPPTIMEALLKIASMAESLLECLANSPNKSVAKEANRRLGDTWLIGMYFDDNGVRLLPSKGETSDYYKIRGM